MSNSNFNPTVLSTLTSVSNHNLIKSINQNQLSNNNVLCNLNPEDNQQMCQNMVNVAKKTLDSQNPFLNIIQNNQDYKQFVSHYANCSCEGYM
jgi:hypothetical protein